LIFLGEGFDVSKSGDARVGLIGFPSGKYCWEYNIIWSFYKNFKVGKSTLLTKLTGTMSKIASNIIIIITILYLKKLF